MPPVAVGGTAWSRRHTDTFTALGDSQTSTRSQRPGRNFATYFCSWRYQPARPPSPSAHQRSTAWVVGQIGHKANTTQWPQDSPHPTSGCSQIFLPPQRNQQHHKSSLICTHQAPGAPHAMAASPCRGAQPLLPGHWGRRGAHLHPQPSSSPPARSESRTTLHTPPCRLPPKQAPARPSKGSGKRQTLPHGVQIPGGAACPKEAPENAFLCWQHHRL